MVKDLKAVEELRKAPNNLEQSARMARDHDLLLAKEKEPDPPPKVTTPITQVSPSAPTTR